MGYYIYVIGGVLLLLLLLLKPIRTFAKKIGVVLSGPALLVGINVIGSFFGGWLGLNVYSLIISLFMGIPGVISLILFKFII